MTWVTTIAQNTSTALLPEPASENAASTDWMFMFFCRSGSNPTRQFPGRTMSSHA